MMTKHKRFLALLLAVVMAIGMVPTAFAEENETEPSTTETTAAATGATEATEAATEATEETKATTTEPAGPQVGDRIWIKSQSAVYKKSSADSVSHTLIGNYEVKITNIITDGDGAPTWYEFEFTSLGIGEAALLIGGYKYVLVENTSVEKPAETKPQETEGTEETTPTTEATTPVDENACNCGENAPESLAQHADSCPRKAYVKSLFEGKTAEEIYANWESYDVGLRTDILGMLEVYDSVKWKALNALIKNSEEDFPTVEIGDVSLAIAVPEDAFPEGTKSTVTEQNGGDFESAIEEVLKGLDPDSNILKLIAMDISFACNGEEVQPSIPVTLTFNIDASDIPSDAESAYVFHIADSGEAEIVGEFPEIGNSEALVLEINAFKFSSYVLGFTGKTYDPILLSTKLSGNSRYSLVEFPVNLFNYEMDAFNSYISGLEGADNYLKFVTDSESFLPNSGGAYATQGIVKKTLKNGYPEMAFGYDNGAYIFNTTEYAGKTVAANKKFEFIYDSQTGYYEYNSALNHAQLSGDKVRLYTDTLSPYNYAKSLALKNFKATKSTVKLTVSSGIMTCKTLLENPRFSITGLSESVSQYSRLYIRLNSETSEKLEVQIKIDNGDWLKVGSVAMTKNAWGEYYFELSDVATSGNITAIRIDPGTSVGKTYNIAQIALISNTGLLNMSNSGFYPFEKIENSFPNQYKDFDISTWGNNLSNGLKTSVSTRSRYNKNESDGYSAVPTEMFHFGMVMETNFYIPQGRTVNGDDIVFEFSGDDDLWVFIDGKLALDIGGGHSIISGSINFTSGAVTVSNAQKINSKGTNLTDVKSFPDLDDALRAPGDHTIKIFYLERFSTASNCRIKFNLPAVPTGNVSVSKTVVEQEGYDITDSLSFTFNIMVKDENYAGKGYTLVTKDTNGNVTNKTSGTTNDKGQFNLAHNQTAYFDGIDENSTVKITEVTHRDGTNYEYKSTTVNGTTETRASGTTSANGILAFNYVNTYKQKTVKINYKVAEGDGTVAPASETLKVKTGTASGSTATAGTGYEFVGWYAEQKCTTLLSTDAKYVPTRPDSGWKDGTTYWAKFVEVTVPLHYVVVGPEGCGTVDLNDDTATGPLTSTTETVLKMTGNAVGATAEASQNFTFVGWYADEACTQQLSTEASYVPAQPETGGWVEKTYYAKFEYALGDLTITKTGIESVDHHGSDQDADQEQQSTIYTVSGTSYSGKVINMQVTICGNGSITIKDLPAGEYTVTEDQNWSWRYDAEAGSQSVTVTVSGANVTFKNDRTEESWLSGDNFCKNLFKSSAD